MFLPCLTPRRLKKPADKVFHPWASSIRGEFDMSSVGSRKAGFIRWANFLTLFGCGSSALCRMNSQLFCRRIALPFGIFSFSATIELVKDHQAFLPPGLL